MARGSGDAHHPHVVVVGAGIIGASIAMHLAWRGAPVTIVDAGRPGTGATAISFAWINARDKNPRGYHDLNRRSIDMWDRLQRRARADGCITWGGELRWASTPEGAEDLARRVGVLQRWGYPIEVIDAGRVRALEPGLVTGAVTAGSFTSIDGHVDTATIVEACLREATDHGADLRTAAGVSAFRLASRGPGRSGGAAVDAVTVAGADLAADVVVLAAGADTTALAAMAGVSVRAGWTFGATALTEPLPRVFERVAVVHTPRDRSPMLNVRQLPDGRVMLHGGSHGGTEDESMGRTDEEVEQVLRAATEHLPALAGARIVEVRRGRRPMPADGQPILGFCETVPNLYLATMHSGVTLAPIVGELACSEILDTVRVDDLEPYRPGRFGPR